MLLIVEADTADSRKLMLLVRAGTVNSKTLVTL